MEKVLVFLSFVFSFYFYSETAFAIDCEAAELFYNLANESCEAGNQDSCSALSAYKKNYDSCQIQSTSNDSNDANVKPKKFGFVKNVQNSDSVTMTRSENPYCMIENTWDDFVYEKNGVRDWGVDYLINNCPGITVIILQMYGKETVYHSRGYEQIKHYRRTTNDISYRWCPQSDYEENGDCTAE